MQKRLKDLKFYNWLSKITPLFFELNMKLFYDYAFFERAAQSLRFTYNYWIAIEIELHNMNRFTMPGLLKYEELQFLGDTKIFYQLLLKIAVFHWKFIPCILNDFFKAYPLFNIPFAELEISIFDCWLDLPVCIDEIYNIILENQWDHVLAELWLDPIAIPSLSVGFTVNSHFSYEKNISTVSEFIKQAIKDAGKDEKTFPLKLDTFKDP